jgi:ribonuclease R
MREKILAHLRSHHYRPLRLRRLAHFFDVAEDDYADFRTLVKGLIDEGEIALGARGKLVPAERPAPTKRPREPRRAGAERTVQGRFSLSARGFGFVEPDSPDGPTRGEDVYVGPGDTAGAVTNDTVLAQVTRKTPRGYAGRIVEIVQRGQTRFVGTYLVVDGRPIVRPDGGVLLQDFPVPDPGAPGPGARPKDKVVFEVLKYALPGEPGEAVIVEVLGHRGDPGVDTLAVIRQFDLPDEFSDGALAEARRAAARLNEEALRSRRDLAGETVITIDPEDARDYDDAISLTRNRDGTVTLGVHIADVSHFVQEGSPLDAEARERGTSVYLPTTVIPMLPGTLSNGACSLQEGRTRLTKSAFITFDRESEPVRAEFANSYIRSAKRLTYQQAQAALDGNADGLSPQVVDLLRAMDDLARRLLERRRRSGYLELDLPQVDLEFDDQGRVVAAHPEDASFTHRIIEMFMVEANEAVARELAHRGIPFIRRVHPDPEPEATEELKHYARSVGQMLHDPSDRLELQRLLNRVRGRPEAYGIHLAVLKSLRRAEYSTKAEGHFALASDAYCHFTSPIRRYPDLVVHRALDRVLRGEAKKPRQKGKPTGASGDGDLDALARHSSQTERRAEAAERELTKVKLLEFLEAKVGEVYSGVITGVQAFGLFVEIPHLLIDGLVHVSSLKDDQYEFDRKRWALVGRRQGRILRVGSEFQVRIVRVDIPRRQLDLEPVETPGASPAPEATPPRKTGKPSTKRPAKRARKGKRKGR